MVPFAKPLATIEQIEKINKAIDSLECKISGIKACTKEIKNGSKGVVILTADITPMDLITHIPALCEDKGVKFLFVEKKELLTSPNTCLFVKKEDCMELYETLK